MRAGQAVDLARADLTEEAAAKASIAVAAVRAVSARAAVDVSSGLFEVCGTRSALESLNLNRHWRNARTHTLHDPAAWKVQHIGRYAVDGTPPPTARTALWRPMTARTFHWFLPTNGDSRAIVGGGHGVAAGAAGGDRPATIAYLGQVARSAEQLGFDGALTPTGAWCEDAWLTTAMLSQVSERLKFLVAFRPGLISPTLAAQMAATFQRLSGGRLLLNVVTGGESHEQRAYGDFLDKDARYARTGEFLDIVRALWRGETVTYDGQAPAGRGRPLARCPIRCRRSTSAARRRPPARRRRQARRRLPDLGRAARAGRREDRLDPRPAPARAGPCGSASGCT